MTDSRLNALSPLDGRYAEKCADLAALFSEGALIARRVRVEAAWFTQLAGSGRFPALAGLAARCRGATRFPGIAAPMTPASRASRTSSANRTTTSRRSSTSCASELAAAGATPAQLEFVHFACTSEDINNLAYALMLAEARERVLLPAIGAVADAARGARRRAMRRCRCSRARTARRRRRRRSARRPRTSRRACAAPPPASARVEILGKFNGAVGNFNAHLAAFPARGLARGVARARRGARPRAERAHDADRAARLDRGVLRCARAREHRARSTCAATSGATSRSATSRRAPSPARSARRRCRTRSTRSSSRTPRATRASRTRCCATSRTSCRCRAGSATSRTRP